MQLHKNQNIPLYINTLSSDGNGVGRYEGQVVFVPGAAPGDSLRVKIVKADKRLAYGRVEQVITPGPGRVTPECSIAGPCGGCDFRHVEYAVELAAKRQFVADALKRIGGLGAEVPPVLASPEQERYRNKVQYPLQDDGSGKLVYGFYAGRSHRVVPCVDCLLQPRQLNEIAAYTAGLLDEAGVQAYNEQDGSGLARHLYLRSSTYSGEVLVCIVAAGPLPEGEVLAGRLAARFPQIKTVVLNLNPNPGNVILGKRNLVLCGDGTIHDSLCGVPLQLDTMSFSQVNSRAAELLFAKAAEFAAVTPEDTLLDLYCGAGVIGLSMAKHCKRLIGVEIVPEAVENARRSAAEMGLANTRFLCEDAGAAADRLAREGLRPDVITVDPPRKGCDAATIKAMLRMAARRIVMVSCNPATMARDLKALCEGGYRLVQVQPADMFPRTKHVECVCLLVHDGRGTT